MTEIIITGANRGIGLKLTEMFTDRGEHVTALCRSASDALKKTGATVIEGIDVTDPESLKKLGSEAGKDYDLLINNAGILRSDNLKTAERNEILEQFKVNSLGPLEVTLSLLDRIKDGGRIAVITSRMGSIADNGSGQYYGYRMSKAAVNAAFVSLARDLENRNISVGILHPGMVATEMTGRQGIPVEEAASGLIQRIDELNAEKSGRFFHQNGEELPW